jgi:hypothetical protein
MKRTILFLCFFFSTLTFTFAQEVNRSNIDVSKYGGKLGVGISILDGLGVPVRYYVTPKNVLEGGMYIGSTIVYNDFEFETIGSGFVAGLGYTRLGDRFVKEKRNTSKIRANGVALRYRRLFGDFKTNFLSLGWAMETSRATRPHRSFIFELGLQGSFPNFVYDNRTFDQAVPGIYLRCHWNFFID